MMGYPRSGYLIILNGVAMISRSPLVNRIGIAVSAIAMTALISMASTLTVSRSIEGNATAINVSGSLRMGAYGLLNRVLQESNGEGDPAGFTVALERYEERIAHSLISNRIPREPDHPLNRQYRSVKDLWQSRVLPGLRQASASDTVPRSLLETTNTYVAAVDRLVAMLEERTEARIDLLHLIQIISLVFSVMIVIALFLDLKNRVLRPLRKLVDIAMAVGERDFSRKASLSGSDELARLGAAFDQMTSELALSYNELEEEAREKTKELQIGHTALELLHSASRKLFANHDLCSGAVPMLQDLEELLGIGPIRLYLHDRNASEPVESVTTSAVERPFYCRDHHCHACLVTPEQFDELPNENNDGRRLLLPIRTPNQLLGTLEVWYPADKGLSETARRLLETLSDQLATAIFLERQITEEQQMTLVEERTVIARELHDSLAQSLSYLKMQVARLRRLDVASEQKPAHDDILEQLSTGLNSAYRQLRELLTTFRLKLDTPELSAALRKTIDEFSERLGHTISLEYDLPLQTLSPNEEIHTLQIVREGLANAVKHSEADEVSVKVLFRTPQVQVSISDNGRGLPDTGTPSQHYGLIIMEDRARTLGGQMQVRNREGGGAEVILTFIPKSRHLIDSKASNA